jgi:hypothetical protein
MLPFESSSDTVPSPSIPIICRFPHRFRCFSWFSSFIIAAASVSISIATTAVQNH